MLLIQNYLHHRYRSNWYLCTGKWFVICGVPIPKRIELSVRKVVRVRCFDKGKSYQNPLFNLVVIPKDEANVQNIYRHLVLFVYLKVNHRIVIRPRHNK